MTFSIVDLQAFQRIFAAYDLDGNGAIGLDELRQAMHRLGEQPTDGELRRMIKVVDENQNGQIDFDEFLKLMDTDLIDRALFSRQLSDTPPSTSATENVPNPDKI